MGRALVVGHVTVDLVGGAVSSETWHCSLGMRLGEHRAQRLGLCVVAALVLILLDSYSPGPGHDWIMAPFCSLPPLLLSWRVLQLAH